MNFTAENIGGKCSREDKESAVGKNGKMQ
jgi:hypothetical protein